MIALTASLLAAMTLSSPAFSEPVRQINTCFEESVAALRSTQLEQGIAHCDKVIDELGYIHGAARAGLCAAWIDVCAALGARLNASVRVPGDRRYQRRLRLQAPAIARKHQLLLIRAQLYAATGQNRRALDDFTAVLDEDPNNIAAGDGRKMLGPVEGF